MVTQIYKIRSQIGRPATKKLWWPKNTNFGAVLDHLVANITGTKQEIIQQKTALQTAIAPALEAILVNFGLLK